MMPWPRRVRSGSRPSEPAFAVSASGASPVKGLAPFASWCGRLATPEVNISFSLPLPPRCIVSSQWPSSLSVLGGKTEAMYSLRYRVVLLTLMACVAFTEAGSSRNSRDEYTTLSLTDGSVTDRGTFELSINDEQRRHIFEGVIRIYDAPVAGGPTPEVADALPEQVPMQELPTGITQNIPLVQGHKFVKFDDRILIVNPSTRLVVAMIPRYKLLPWRSDPVSWDRLSIRPLARSLKDEAASRRGLGR